MICESFLKIVESVSSISGLLAKQVRKIPVFFVSSYGLWLSLHDGPNHIHQIGCWSDGTKLWRCARSIISWGIFDWKTNHWICIFTKHLEIWGGDNYDGIFHGNLIQYITKLLSRVIDQYLCSLTITIKILSTQYPSISGSASTAGWNFQNHEREQRCFTAPIS